MGALLGEAAKKKRKVCETGNESEPLLPTAVKGAEGGDAPLGLGSSRGTSASSARRAGGFAYSTAAALGKAVQQVDISLTPC